ncbi:DUF4190 domain-containing protein [uncultured Aeromicrobium sp.]|uniref:DUF4190 domain-containing protein n=1 Tax=uncultured Aeromicrobium sp. TaxID=337820 RepID=UPI0025DC0D9D|nr:DUF4190 domain-containing protein [uncultured Aeromicrobium sp.]
MSSYPTAPQGDGWQPPAKHPQATVVLILGILGIVVCSVLAPVAWVMGNRAVREIDASPQPVGGRGEANAGRILGIVGTVLLAVGILAIIVLAVMAALADSSGY